VTTEAAGGDSSSDVQREAPLTVFVSDPSAEAEKITQALRAAGYAVVDVPMSMLIARVAVQTPRVILVDADAEGALDAISRLRDLPDAEAIDVVFIGKEGAALQGPEDAMAHEGSGFFSRPVDVPALVRKVQVLTGGPVGKEAPTRASAPPSVSGQQAAAPVGDAAGRPVSLPPASMRTTGSDPPRVEKRVSDRPPPMPWSQPPGTTEGGTHSGSAETSRRSPSIQAPLSSELEMLLAEAEQRIGGHMVAESILPTPEEEIEAVLPAEILAALDEPIDEEDEDDLDLPRGASRHGEGGESAGLLEAQGTGARQITSTGRAPQASDPGEAPGAKTHGGREDERSATTGTRSGQSSIDTSSRVDLPSRELGGLLGPRDAPGPGSRDEPFSSVNIQPGPATEHLSSPAAFTAPPPPLLPRRAGEDAIDVTGMSPQRGPPQPRVYDGGPSIATLGSGNLEPHVAGLQEIVASSLGAHSTQQPPAGALSTRELPATQGVSKKAGSVPPPAAIPSVIGKTDAPLVLARAIALRSTGALCIEAEDGVRRVVLREGDLVTAASGVETESLLAFLGSRGELPRETVHQLAGKVPPFGRHAGAALVAHGHLRQDQLWPVLRAHAEWILGRITMLQRGTALLEPEPPGRLKGEPSVFGGSTGAEVLIEVLRRVVAPDEATARLGGPSSRVTEGPSASLLSECALDAGERDLIARLPGGTVGDLVGAANEADFASVLYGLSLLGVIEIIRAIAPARGDASLDDDSGPHPVDTLDEDAMRERVRARLALVDEADYFALLGLSPDATGYEVRRAFLELRRAFDPQRVLTPQIADLADDVNKIVGVLEEAYEILRDNARRERYRRAIVASP
jgi:hypothetical protein